MPLLSWIDDNTLIEAIEKFNRSAQNCINSTAERQKKNTIDPFMSLMVSSKFSLKSKKDLIEIQNLNAILKGMSNALGTFHQDVLSGVEGWRNHDAGYDLECEELKILAEIKNKHNTMNASTRGKVELDLDIAVQQKGRGWTGYLVFVVPRKPERYCKELPVKRRLYEIDGVSFYEMITNSPNALHDLFDVFCGEASLPEEITGYLSEVFENSFPSRLYNP